MPKVLMQRQLLRDFRTSTATDDAVKEIEASDADVKKAISDRLPALMQNEDNYVIRNNGSKLAEDLKVAACVPILYRLYVKGDALPTGVTSPIRWRLMDDPVGHALVQIGDPAIPYMKELLKSSDKKANGREPPCSMVLPRVASSKTSSETRRVNPTQ
jgi:hypothetical protein